MFAAHEVSACGAIVYAKSNQQIKEILAPAALLLTVRLRRTKRRLQRRSNKNFATRRHRRRQRNERVALHQDNSLLIIGYNENTSLRDFPNCDYYVSFGKNKETN